MSTLTVETIGINSVQPHPDNPRKGNLEAIAESLQRSGQYKPIVVQKSTGYVIAGNHTREAARDLGWEEISAVLLDADDEQAKVILLADNRTADLASYDQAKLYESLERLLDLEGTGYDLDYVESLGDALGANVGASSDTGAVVKQAAPEAKAPIVGQADRPAAEPMRDIVMLMTVSRAQSFGEKVARLQKAWSTRTVVDTVERAIDEAVASLPDA